MDIRVEKTKRSIINAFIEIRAKKEIERITVKELCERSEINKSTFYAHYHDIYDLSEQLETEVVTSIMDTLEHPEYVFDNPEAFIKELYIGYVAKNALIQTLFSGTRQNCLVQKIEHTIKELAFEKYPQYRDDPQKNILLSYSIYGSYYAFYENRSYGDALTIGIIGKLLV